MSPPVPKAFASHITDDWHSSAERTANAVTDPLATPKPVGTGQVPFPIIHHKTVIQHLAEESDEEVVARVAIRILGGEDVITANKRIHLIAATGVFCSFSFHF
jgi:hypothetical protein